MTKCCTKCNIEKDISHFLFSRGKKRYLAMCNECRKNYSKLYRQRNMNGTVYVYTNKINGKQYVGQTWKPKERKAQHTLAAKKGTEPSPFHNALNKYGVEGFSYMVVKEGITSQAEMDKIEEEAICEFNTLRPNGYNIMTGGASGRPDDEMRRQMGKRKCVRPVICIETGKIYGNSKEAEEDTGILFSDITRAARGVVKVVGGFHWAYWHEGFIPEERHFSPSGNTGKRVVCVETEEIFPSIAEAAKSVGKDNPSSICACLKGRSNYAHGYRWMFYEEYVKNPPDKDSLPSVQGIGKYKPVICVETGKVYANCPAAERETGISVYRIRDACNLTRKTMGHDIDGQTWVYLEEYKKEKERCKTTQTQN